MEKLRIGFFVSTKLITEVDLTHPEKGNPGIGATEYLFVLIASQLTKTYRDEIEIIFMYDYAGRFPVYLNQIQVKNTMDAVTIAKKIGVDLLVLRSMPDANLFHHIEFIQQKVITWSHNRIWIELADMISKNKYVVRNICVGAHQALDLADHDIFKKTEVIFNPVMINKCYKRDLKEPVVTFVGHIDKARGFHVLAKVWKDVIQEVPNARMNVIGSATLYDRNVEVGGLGIANKKYEKRFSKYISLEDGSIMPSVNFLGIVGQEKEDIFKTTSVGVINPTGYETLGLSGLEMEACGIPLVTANKHGQSEIVKHKYSGYLFNRNRDLKKYLITLLIDTELNNQMGINAKNYVNEKFDINNILSQWKEEFNNILDNNPPLQREIQKVKKTKMEKIRLKYGIIRANNLFNWLPTITRIETDLKNIVAKIINIRKTGW